MRAWNFGFVQAATAFAVGVMVGGGLLGGMPQDAQAVPRTTVTGTVKGSCASHDAIADFVCRNTWLAHTRHTYR